MLTHIHIPTRQERSQIIRLSPKQQFQMNAQKNSALSPLWPGKNIQVQMWSHGSHAQCTHHVVQDPLQKSMSTPVRYGFRILPQETFTRVKMVSSKTMIDKEPSQMVNLQLFLLPFDIFTPLDHMLDETTRRTLITSARFDVTRITSKKKTSASVFSWAYYAIGHLNGTRP